MLSGEKLKQLSKRHKVSTAQLAGQIVRGGLDSKAAESAVKNWMRGLYKPEPTRKDISKLASALGVDANEISQWQATHRYAPISPRKAQLVTQLIAGKDAQDALDILKFTPKRAASFVEQTLKSAIANADENQADVESLYVKEARVGSAGVRLGTKRWMAKDRGRAHSIRKMGSHIYITVSE